MEKLIGEKPVVLCLGNFTCGPFRSMYPGVDDVYTRYKDKANFLMVYVREAHPTDGWKMASNARAGVEVKQPITFDDRVGVANQFCTRLKPNLPVVVDEITDTTSSPVTSTRRSISTFTAAVSSQPITLSGMWKLRL